MTDGGVLVRPYQEGDRAAALALARRLRVGVAAWRDPEAVEAAVVGWVRDAVDDGRDVLVAVAGERLVGLVTVGRRTHFTGQVDAYVGELVVAEDAERQGVGRQLMRAAEAWGRRNGLAHLTLETGAANRGARAFYAGLGYREEDVRLTKALDSDA